jgi:hypothetical protein
MSLEKTSGGTVVRPEAIFASSSAVLLYRCWGPSASEGPQKHDLTVFLEYNV